MARTEVVIDYTPRAAFMPFHRRSQRWACLVVHRRGGKTVAAINDLIRAAITYQGPYPLFGYVAPYRSQAKSVAWGYLKEFAAPIMRSSNEQELTVTLLNGAVIRLHGADSADSMRGLGFSGIICDEFGDWKPSVFPLVVRPALSDKGGWAVMMGTPKGKNQFWDIVKTAQNDSDWFYMALPASKSGLLPVGELEAAKAQISEDQYLQEYECSFEAAITGAIYGTEMRLASEGGRICEVPYDPAVPVYTSWDLGYRDDTAVWWYQVVAGEIRVLDFHAVSGATIKDLCEVVLSKPYKYGKHHLPHDARAKTLASGGKSIIEQMAEFLGLANLTIVPDLGVQDGIQAVRRILPRCWFHVERCDEGIEALRQYQREYDEDKKAFRQTPRHDWCSHPCLVAGSMIQTHRGLVAIEDVCVGDMVFTPAGYSLVTNAGPTKNADKLIEIVTTDGALTCTPEHKILTSRGFVIADALRYSDRIFSGKEWQCKLIGLFSRVLPTGFRVNITGEMSGEVRGHQTYTEQYGCRSMGQFLMGLIFITLMKIRSTMTLPILRASIEPTINGNTLWSASHLGSYSPRANLHCNERQNGILPQRVLRGIANTARKRGKIASGMSAIAISAGSYIARLILRAPSSAMRIVSSRLVECGTDRPLVYDLTVKKNGCYQANGLLVSNCDAFRMLAVAWQIEPARPVPKLEKPLMVGPDNEVSLNDMWAVHEQRTQRRARI